MMLNAGCTAESPVKLQNLLTPTQKDSSLLVWEEAWALGFIVIVCLVGWLFLVLLVTHVENSWLLPWFPNLSIDQNDLGC